MLRGPALAVTACALLLVGAAVAPSAPAATGGSLRALPTDSCITAFSPAGTPCVQGRGMEEYYPEIAISPDGRHIYATNHVRSAVTVHDRNATTGGIVQKAGAAGCLYDSSEADVPPGCTAVAGGFLGASNVIVSPDGRHVYVAGGDERTVATFRRDADTGVLTYAGCVGQVTGCSPGRRMDGIFELAIAPDGRHVYAAARGTGANDGAVLTLGRDATTGLLAMDAGAAHCLSSSGASTCTVDPTIGFPREIVVTPDNAFVYVADGTGQVVGYHRNTTTGVLARVDPATGGCVAAAAVGDCVVHGPIGNAPENLALSPDATKLYVTSYWDGELHTLERSATGRLTPIPSACFTEAADADCANSAANLKTAYGLTAVDGNIYVAVNDQFGGGSNGSILTFDVDADGLPRAKPQPFGCVHRSSALCTSVGGMTGMLDVVASPDGRHVYGYGFGTLIGTARDKGPSCSPAAATAEAGKVAVIQLDCSDPDGDAVAYEIVEPPASGVLAPPDASGKAQYAAPGDAAGRSVTFRYRGTAFGGTSDVVTATIAVTSPPAGTPPPATTQRITSTVSHRWRRLRTRTRLTRLVVDQVPAGATITVRCTLRGRRKGCPFGKVTRKVSRTGRVDMLRSIRRSRRNFRFGSKVEIRVTAPGRIGRVVTLTTRRRKRPLTTTRCLPVGSTTPQKTCG